MVILIFNLKMKKMENTMSQKQKEDLKKLSKMTTNEIMEQSKFFMNSNHIKSKELKHEIRTIFGFFFFDVNGDFYHHDEYENNLLACLNGSKIVLNQKFNGCQSEAPGERSERLTFNAMQS